jgi:pimeloyl-ACP methyl ester carboxylesterase
LSWNKNVDYRRQLALSGRRKLVETLYRAAGLGLDGDLDRLNRGPSISATPAASDYMLRHYTPYARPAVPLVAVQAIGDGLTSPSMQRAYAEAAGKGARSLWVPKAGHCGFKPETVLATLHFLERRLDKGKWGERPAGFVDHVPAPMLRPCFRGRTCR